jgi:hypothetical protein
MQSNWVDVSRALAQISEIHQQIAKGEVFRGYRSVPIALSSAIAIGAAWLQTPSLGVTDPRGFVFYWITVALVAALVGASEIIYNYIVHEDGIERRRTRQVVGQFLPSILAGGVITISFLSLSAGLVPLLPGLWAICMGLGTFASRPYLPRASGFVALFYYAAGFVLLGMTHQADSLSGWWVGLTFGVGQLLAAAVLYWNLERQ